MATTAQNSTATTNVTSNLPDTAVLPAEALHEVRQAVQSAIAPLAERQHQLQQRLEQLAAPRTQAAGLFGGVAPGVRLGEDPLSSRGYQYWRAIGYRQGYVKAENAKLELELDQRLARVYVDQGGLSLQSANSVLAPLGSCMLAGQDDRLAGEVRQMLAGGIAGAEPVGIRRIAQTAYGAAVTQNLSQYDESGLAGFIGSPIRGELIELLRQQEVFSRTGATQLSLPPNGRVQFDRQTGASTAYWVGEVPSDRSGPGIPASEPRSGTLVLSAKKLAALVKMPNELMRFATPDLEAFIRMDLARSMALAADAAMLDGVGSTNAIKGLLTYPGVSKYVAGNEATNGDTLAPEDIQLMLATVEDFNHDADDESAAWVMRPRMWAQLLNRRAVGPSSGVFDGGWLFPATRGDIGQPRPSFLSGRPVVRSNQVSRSRSKGSANNLTYVLFGLFRHWIIGRVGVVEFATSTQGDTAFTADQTWIRAIQHLDAGPRYENAFVYCDQLTM